MPLLMRIALPCLAALLTIPAFAAIPAKNFKAELKLFEQADMKVIPMARRVYSTHFDAMRTRMLGIEIAASYEAAKESLVPVNCTLRQPTGSELPTTGDMELKLFAGESESNSAKLMWGAADEADWTPGLYEIDCSMDGKSIGKAAFEMTLGPPDIAGVEVRVAELRMFAAGTELPAKADRTYVNTFPKADTRRIGVELEFTHAALNQNMAIPVECHYFWPDGQTSPTIELRYEPEATWAGGYSAGSIGWDEAGQWPAGVYTAACSIHGRPVIVDRFAVE